MNNIFRECKVHVQLENVKNLLFLLKYFPTFATANKKTKRTMKVVKNFLINIASIPCTVREKAVSLQAAGCRLQAAGCRLLRVAHS
jgi:hypothetical protein